MLVASFDYQFNLQNQAPQPSPPYIPQDIEEMSFRKTLWKKVKLLKMSNFTFFHNVFYAVYLKIL